LFAAYSVAGDDGIISHTLFGLGNKRRQHTVPCLHSTT